MIKEIKSYKNFQYVIRYPKNTDEGKKYPLVICLHGAGGRGTDIESVKTHTNFVLTEEFGLDMIMVSPLCYADTWFDIFEQLMELVRYLCNMKNVDREHVCLMGGSLGGYTAWQLAMTMPEYFSALVPICGGGMYWNAGRLRDVPVWAFHGVEDTTVLPIESIRMVNAVNAKGGSAKLTLLNGVAHNSWLNAYGSREVFEWMFSQKKSAKE